MSAATADQELEALLNVLGAQGTGSPLDGNMNLAGARPEGKGIEDFLDLEMCEPTTPSFSNFPYSPLSTEGHAFSIPATSPATSSNQLSPELTHSNPAPLPASNNAAPKAVSPLPNFGETSYETIDFPQTVNPFDVNGAFQFGGAAPAAPAQANTSAAATENKVPTLTPPGFASPEAFAAAIAAYTASSSSTGEASNPQLSYPEFLAALYKAMQTGDHTAWNPHSTAILQATVNANDSAFHAALNRGSAPAAVTPTALSSNAMSTPVDPSAFPLSPPYDSASNASFGVGRSSFSGTTPSQGQASGQLEPQGHRAAASGASSTHEGMSPLDLESGSAAVDEDMDDSDGDLVAVKEEPSDAPMEAHPRAESEASTGDALQGLAARPLPPQFGGVKGKGGKKGGGMSSVVLANDEDADEGDDWRPTPEEYKKLSSKEKRQLRNKLSARAFRNRRKTYINELEDHIKDRDRLIDAIRTDLNSSKSENEELRREINALKKAAMVTTPASLQKPTPPPAGLGAALSNSTQANAEAGPSNYASKLNRPTANAAPLNMFNPNKDVPSSVFGALSPRAVKGFWSGNGGAFGTGNDFGSGFTSVHTTFTPDLRLPISPPLEGSKGPAPATAAAFTRVNLNPLIPSAAANQQQPQSNNQLSGFRQGDGTDLTDSFEHWSNDTAFSMKSLDSYRMQIWSRMARQAAMDRAGVAADVRPMFLRDAPVSGKKDSQQTPGSPTKETKAWVKNIVADLSNAKAATVQVPAHIDQNAISSRLFGAFMTAFKNGSGSGLDASKMADVVAGKSGLKVVPSEKVASPPTSTKAKLPTLDADSALAASFAHLNMATESLGLKTSVGLEENDHRASKFGFLGRSQTARS